MPDGPLVELERVGVRRPGAVILRDLRLTVSAGEAVGVFGANGSGKTTLLRLVATLFPPSDGVGRVLGAALGEPGVEAVRRRIGFVSHETLVYPDLTTRENLVFYGRLYSLDNPEARADEMLDRMGLEAKSRTTTRSLSRGMKQRLSLARAFIHEPDLLLLDEPFTGLDEQAADTLDELLSRFRSGGGSILMASHNIERGWKHADRVAVLDRGGIPYQASVSDTDFAQFHSRYREIISTEG